MLIENTFTVTAPPDDLWNYLLDVEKIAPCMPGAELTETVDDTHWKGKLNMKFGPVSMSFAGEVKMAERDDEAKRVVLSAKGMEQKGKGAANATVTSWLEPGDTGAETTVKMTADIALTGAAAQMSRGLLPEISKKLTQQFADCLQASMAAEQTAKAAPDLGGGGAPAPGKETPDVGSTAAETSSTTPPVATPAPVARPVAKPVGGIGLGLAAVWALIKNFFRRLFGGGSKAS
jgi:uncharacterized protein